MDIKPGKRLQSTVCETEVIVVRGAGDLDLRCGGAPMVPAGTTSAAGAPVAGQDSGTLLGKRYEHVDHGIELLCVKPGKGSLAIGADQLSVVAAKKLPAAD